jgi:acetyltransferase-like isoleucine patch superfamily enzyme
MAHRHGVEFEGRAAIGRDVRFDVAPGARVIVRDGAALGDGCRFHVGGGEVVIGAGAVLGDRCVVVAHERVEVGARSLLADEVVLVDFDHRFDDVDVPVRLQGLLTDPITVGEGARVGPGTALLRGAHVAPGAQIGAHEVVRRRVPRARAAGARRPGPPSRP